MRFLSVRAVAELLNEQLERTLTDALSELGKFDAEARKFCGSLRNKSLNEQS